MNTVSPNLRSFLYWLFRVIVYGTSAGLLVYVVVFGWRIEKRGLLWCLEAGLCYSTVMLSAVEAVIRYADGRRPMRRRADVSVRVAIVAGTALVAFLVATYAAEVILGFRLFAAPGTLTLAAIVALALTAVGSSLYFLGEYKRRLLHAEKAALRAELQALRAQINPHFLFNALNSIAALVRSEPDRAEDVTESLAELFRYSLRASDHPTVSLREEMESVELYLVVERARFGSRIETTLILPAELEDVRVPSLLLQPLVENAVKHGVARRDGTCSITVQAETDSMMVRISVMDDGPGFPQEPMEQILARGHGLRNIRERLRLVYGGDADMSFRNDGVILSLPIHIVETEEPRVDHLLHR